MQNNNFMPQGQLDAQERDKECDHCTTHFGNTPCDVDLRRLTACTTCTFRQGGTTCVVADLEMRPRPSMLDEHDWDLLRQVCDACHIQRKKDCSWLDGGVQARLGPCTNCQAANDLCTRDGNVIPLQQGELYVPGLFGQRHAQIGEDDGDTDMPDADTGVPNAMTQGGRPVVQYGLGPRYQGLAGTMTQQQSPALVHRPRSAYQPQSGRQSQTPHQYQSACQPWSVNQPPPPAQPQIDTDAGPASQSTTQPASARVKCPQCGPGSRKTFTDRGLKMHTTVMHRQQGPAQPSQVNVHNPQAPVIQSQHQHGQQIQGHTVNVFQGQQPQAPVPQPQPQRYTCDFCDAKQDYTVHGLKVHMKLKHPGEEVPVFAAPQVVICPYCHGDYQARGLGVHILHRHPGLPCPDLKDVWQ